MCISDKLEAKKGQQIPIITLLQEAEIRIKMFQGEQLSTIVPQSSRINERGDIRRGEKGKNPELGYKGCRTLYECFRMGYEVNPLGACLGFRAMSTNGLATPYIYSSYTEVLARVNAFAAGLETLNLVPPTDEDNMVLLGLYMKNCVEWFIAEQAIFCVSGATGEYEFSKVVFFARYYRRNLNFDLSVAPTSFLTTRILTSNSLICEIFSSGW